MLTHKAQTFTAIGKQVDLTPQLTQYEYTKAITKLVKGLHKEGYPEINKDTVIIWLSAMAKGA